jgi:phosphatidylserine/phosphatidylglycerophosphate/cardiolipin synthase-like enzyme/uncharacterized membrane protein YdjX (TVP38/TMEM64 family)
MIESRVLNPGRNCWRVEHADRVAFLVDGADYFGAFRETVKRARCCVLVLGWDFDSRFRLLRDEPPDDLPVALGAFLNTVVRRRRGLWMYILDWDYSVMLAPSREWFPHQKLEWMTPRRLCFRMDDHCPVGGSHHQKVVVVDDRVAFAGGLDLTLGRWDSSEHRADDTRRCDLNTTIPQPYHDVQMAVSGPAAVALGDLARERWRVATGQVLDAPPGDRVEQDPWPPGLGIDCEDVDVAIARTYPRHKGQDEVREVERLIVDAIAAAERCLYIENQYFTAHSVGDALAARLAEPEGPEVVIVLPLQTVGWLSQLTMDVLRERLIRRLMAADAHDRLRVYYPHQEGLDGTCINVHAKLMVVDEDLVCVGSANLNNRSMGLDSECVLAFEAGGEARIRDAIGGFRRRLLAEHLDVDEASVSQALKREDSLIATIESLRGDGRSLRPLPLVVSNELHALIPDSELADPECPVDAARLADEFVPESEKAPTRRALMTVAAALILGLALAAVWRWTPFSEWIDIRAALQAIVAMRENWAAPLLVLALFVVGGLLVFPLTLMIVATGIAFGAVQGFAYALAGALASAMVTYLIGHRIGREPLRRLSNQWVERVNRRLSRQGLLAVITLRIVPVAPFSVINLVAGASHIRFRDFAIGSLLGLTPGTLALTVFSDQVAGAIQAPDTVRWLTLAGLAALIAGGSWALGRWLLRRRRRIGPDDPPGG